MLIVMSQDATAAQIDAVKARVTQLGFQARPMPGEQRVAIGIVGNDGPVDAAHFEGMPGVLQVIHVASPYKLVSREWHREDTIVHLPNGVTIGGPEICVMAGPCAVESRDQLLETAESVARAGAVVLRGGAFKPRSNPYSFQGLGEPALELLAEARDHFGLALITEAIDEPSLDLVEQYTDIIQLGARSMQNFPLLKRAGRARKPVLLKRGLAATIREWLLAAEYILAEGNSQVILCERGIRSYDDATRNMLDVIAIPLVKQLSHLPVIADPSHGTGRRHLVGAASRAAIAADADGLLIEVHRQPDQAMSDGAQSLFPGQFVELMSEVRSVAAAIGRSVQAPAVVAR
ncbi:MAG: 3-deoxy-7-phosphoheptulonate synthase [Gemmatimonadota bacterium]|nr:3-deoxy-7-phosphoheptulonate synthase [Gemmatimonadota bacterium]